MVMEPRLEGEYKKHSNNFGFVAFDDRNTPQVCAALGQVHCCPRQV